MRKPSDTSIHPRPPEDLTFFTDRNLGSVLFAGQLRSAGLQVVVHDDVYAQTERDPWIYYECGKKGWVVITSDKAFLASVPHMMALQAACTRVIAFTNNNYNSDVRGNAFLKASSRIFLALAKSDPREPLVLVVGMEGTLRVAKTEKVRRKQCSPRDWESFERVCLAEGLVATDEAPDETGA